MNDIHLLLISVSYHLVLGNSGGMSGYESKD